MTDNLRAPIKLVLADDHPIVQEAMTLILERDPRFEVLRFVNDGEELVACGAVEKADVVVSDLSMGPVNGIEATRRLRERVPGTKVLILSAFGEASLVAEAMHVGACGYMLKSSTMTAVCDAIIGVHEGRRVIDSAISASAARARDIGLSERQIEVLQLLSNGMRREEIAKHLHLSLNTVKSHLQLAYHALGAERSHEAVAKAAEFGLIEISRRPR
jgi:two-component system, NarL family, response regulator DesR